MQRDGDEPTADAQVLRQQLRHVFWIGGGSGAGKSTIARRLAAEYGLVHFATDDVMSDHCKRSMPGGCLLLYEFMAMDMDERWVNRSPKQMLETFHWFRGEGFGMIVEDILRLPGKLGVIVDGFRLLPGLVRPLLAAASHGVWLLPTADFRRAVFDARGWPRSGFLAKTSDPEKAYRNLLERDAMFTGQVRDQAQSVGLRTIEVDAAISEDELTERVARAFGLDSHAGGVRQGSG
ncbi:MAG TPA: AAA family ATPase [Tepidisphaeraceae bacterium]|nr:AAA family ATPase [Tepidisphaeraceae bacterium]